MQQLATKLGGARRDRTDDLLRARQALSQLSYGPLTSLFFTLLRWLFARCSHVPISTLPCSQTIRLASRKKFRVRHFAQIGQIRHFLEVKAGICDA